MSQSIATVEWAADRKRERGGVLTQSSFGRYNYQTLTIKFEDISITRQRADVGCSVRVDYAESEEFGCVSFGPIFQVGGLLFLFRMAVLWLRTHLVVHGLLFT